MPPKALYFSDARNYLFCLRVIILLLSTQGILLAQDPTGRIIGSVTDPQGAEVPNVQIIVTNIKTGISKNGLTDNQGFYQIMDLSIGVYRVTMDHEGFREFVLDNQTLQINQSLRLDGKLGLTTRTEVVSVNARPNVVETVDPTIGGSVTGRVLTDAPLNGRNALDLALLQPGVMPHNPDDRSSGSYNIAGGRSDSVTFLLDGGQNNEILGNGVVFNPNPDNIAEFRILENNYTAEYGRNSGGVISEVTRSGTNEWHGSAFDFVRNGSLNANSFFNKNDPSNLLPRDSLRRNQAGGTFGGPISIPRVVNGKDRFFFFLGYQQQIQSSTVSSTGQPVPTPAQLGGDFSQSGQPGNGQPASCPNADSNVAAFLLANPFFQSDPVAAACAIIDSSKINPIAKNYISAGLVPTSLTGLLNSQSAAQNNNKEVTTRFDLNLAKKDQLSVTLGGFRNPTLIPFDPTASGAPGYGSRDNVNNYFANFVYGHMFSTNTLNEFRATLNRNNILNATPQRVLPGPSALGFTNVSPDQTTGPPILIFDSSGLTLGFSPQGPTNLVQNSFVYSDTVSWVDGHHAFKAGGGLSAYQSNIDFDFFVDGAFDFVGQGGIGTGNDFADFLTGQPIDFQQGPRARTNARTKFAFGFAQDEWRENKNLTLTLGMRYEYSTPKLDTHGYTFNVIPGQQSSVFPNAPRGLVFPGDRGAPRGVNFPDKNNWAPRIGFAWDPAGAAKTSIRGGFGVFYDILKAEDNLQDNGQPPFFSSAFLLFNPLSGNPSTDIPNVADPFDNSSPAEPNPFPSKPVDHNVNFASAGFLPFGGTGIFLDDPHLRTPYVYHYNLSIQREIAAATVLEIGYLGSSSHKLTSTVDINPMVLGSTNRILNLAQGNSTCTADTGNCTYTNLEEFKNVSNANYNALEVNLTRQVIDAKYLGRTYFKLGYTWAHSIDNASGARNRNSSVPAYAPGLFRSSSDFDIRQRIVFSGGWDLPFDRLFTSAPRRLTQGWSLFPIISWRTGFPLDVFSAIDSSGGFTNPGTSGAGDPNLVHANLVGPINTFDPRQVQSLTGQVSGTNSGNFYFNPGAFSTAQVGGGTCLTPSPSCFPSSAEVVMDPQLATYGTLPRNFFRGPGQTNMDLAFAKSIAIMERLKVEIRADLFNVFNHSEFNNPNVNITSPLFGQVTTTAPPRIIQLAARFTF